MSLEVELDCNGLLSKQDEMAIDTSDSNSILRNINELKEEEEDDNVMHNNNNNDDDNDDNNNLDLIKQRELIQHLKDLCVKYAESVHSLEESLDHVTRENEAYDSQIAALKQHNEYLREASTQCHTRYNDIRTTLLNANQEIITLKTELTNLQLLYQQNVVQIENDNKILNETFDDENDINNTMKQCIEENKQIKKENIKYLNQLKEMNNKYRESNTKYDDLNNIQIDLQNELNESKSRISDLDSIVHEYFLEIRYLEHQNADLKQTLNEITNLKEVYDENGNAIPISYAPDIKRKRHWRQRSMSQISAPSSCSSPTAVNFAINADLFPYEYSITNDDDQYDDQQYNDNDIDDNNMKKNGSDNDDMEKLYDLYQAVNDYLDEMEQCVESIKSIKTIQFLNNKKKHNLARKSRTNISMKYRKNNKNNKNNDDEKEKEEDDDDDDDDVNDDDDDDDDDEIDPETICTILDKNEEQEQLGRIADIIGESRGCIMEMHRQQMVMMTAEKAKYLDLDITYSKYQKRSAQKIKRLTKDMYTIQYKKYVGYRQICWEMVGNVGTYTKDKIIYKLTH